jgi:2,3-bisphosphoglycerate-independent phosphoglycerate mutase
VSGPVCLIILDGFGIGDGSEGDAIAQAQTPFFDRCNRLYPRSRLLTSGRAVGLPDGQMGNSEVGHMTLGAGRIIQHELVRIQDALDANRVATDPELQRALQVARAAGGHMHLMGLVSDGGVHSSMGHLEGLLAILEREGIRAILHAFTDGRDTSPNSALRWIEPLEGSLAARGGSIATVSGRYYAMDRDKRWERIARAYAAIVERQGVPAASARAAVEKAYTRGEGDEFIQPAPIGNAPALRDGDAVLFFNFRADRARELTHAITRRHPDALGAEVLALPQVRPGIFLTLTQYDQKLDLPVLFAPQDVSRGLGELLSEAGKRQLRIAETEKYAHVTYFFNGGVETPFPGEDRILVPSPRDVPTYDLKPQMSAPELTRALLEALERDYDFVLANFANPDMVGHTGVLPAAIEAVQTVDECLGRIADAVLLRGGSLLITADHGNIEQMIDPETGLPHTAHTTGPVPLWWVLSEAPGCKLADGGLADVAPTLCELLALTPSPEMTGRDLIQCGPRSSSF